MNLVIDYIELGVADVAEAKHFYGEAVGWSPSDYGPDYAGHRRPEPSGEEFGGLSAHGAPGGGVRPAHAHRMMRMLRSRG